MQSHRHFFGIFFACAVATLGAAASAAQSPSRSLTPAAQQPTTLTGCVEYGPRDSYILVTMNAPAQPDLSNESAVERLELADAEHSYQLAPARGEQLSQLVGAKVRAAGVLSRVPGAASTGGRGQTSASSALDRLSTSSVQKLADHCDARLTMFAL